MHFVCVPKMRIGYQQIAAEDFRPVDFLRDDGSLSECEGGLVLIYMCFDVVPRPFHKLECEWSGERVLRRARAIFRGYPGLERDFVAVLLEPFDESALSFAEREEIERLTLTTVKECLVTRRHPAL